MKEHILPEKDLADIRTVKVDPDLPKQEKIIDHVRQLNRSPNRYKCGKFTITEIHPQTGAFIEDCLLGIYA